MTQIDLGSLTSVRQAAEHFFEGDISEEVRQGQIELQIHLLEHIVPSRRRMLQGAPVKRTFCKERDAGLRQGMLTQPAWSRDSATHEKLQGSGKPGTVLPGER